MLYKIVLNQLGKMFKPFVAASAQKIIGFLGKHDNFFETKEETRKEKLKDLQMPESFVDYLLQTDEKQFLADLSLMSNYAKGAKSLNLKKNKFFLAIVQFMTADFARKLDLLDNDFYLFTPKSREVIVDKLISSDSNLANTLKNILLTKTYQQISAEIYELSNKVQNAPYILVQSPREISPELKKEIRQKIKEENATHFPIFQINQKLIGGIRIFKNGESNDQSWLSRVLHYTSLTSA